MSGDPIDMNPPAKIEISCAKRDWHPSPLPGQIVLVTTMDEAGEPNVAPKSWISMAAFGPPPILMFGCNRNHATARNALTGGEFVINVPGSDLVETCWAVAGDQAAPRSGRFARHALTPIPALRVRSPRIAECRAHLECELDGSKEWGEEIAIFGRVVSASLDARLAEGDPTDRYRLLAPCFFLEETLAAPLGEAFRIGDAAGAVRHVLTIIAVNDLARSARFYRRAFDWQTVVEVPVYIEFALPGGRRFGIYQREAFGSNTGEVPPSPPAGALTTTELYFHVTALDDAIGRLESAGARCLSPLSPRSWGDAAAYYADPDGNVLVLARPLGPAGMPGGPVT